MKISFRYDDGVAVIPKKVLDKSAAQASREDLLVLLSLAADPAVPAAERAEALGIGKDELEQSISFWKRNKIISVELDEGEKLPAYKKKNAESDSEAYSASAKSASSPLPSPLFFDAIHYLPSRCTNSSASFLYALAPFDEGS